MDKLKFIVMIVALSCFAGVLSAQDDAGVNAVLNEEPKQKDRLPYLCVSGVIPSEGKPLAVINGEVVEELAIIDGVRVIEIDDSGVAFRYKDKAFRREIGEGCQSAKPSLPAQVASLAETEPAKVLRRSSGLRPRRDFSDLDADQVKAVTAIVGIAWVIGLILYVYISLSIHIIAAKTNTEYAWFAWIPLLNVYLMCRIAGKSMFFLFLFLIPFVNIFAIIVVWMGIAEARGKPSWLGILMVLPIISLIIPGYLAFSD